MRKNTKREGESSSSSTTVDTYFRVMDENEGPKFRGRYRTVHHRAFSPIAEIVEASLFPQIYDPRMRSFCFDVRNRASIIL